MSTSRPTRRGAQASSALALKLLSKTALSSTHGTISQRIAGSISLAGASASGRSNPWAISNCGLSTNFETARILQTARTRLFANHRSVALDGENATAEEARIRWRDRAEDAIVMIEGLAAAIQGIQAAHFRSAEIVHTTSAKVLRRLRSRLRSIVRLFSGLWENGDPLRTYFDDRSCPQDRATAYSPQVRGYLKRIEQSIAQSGESLAHEFILEARRDALRDVNEWEAANRLADQVLDQHLSERKDGGR